MQFSGARERYRFDESIRAYALEGLAASGELATLARRHAEWALESGESMTATARTGDLSWRPDAQDELENWRAALRWALLERGDVVLGQRLVGALGVVSLGVGTYFGVRAIGDWHDASAACPIPSATRRCA